MNQRSIRTVLKSSTSAFGRRIELVHRTAGYEVGVGVTRDVDEAWAYLSYDRDGTRHGQWFRTEEEAAQKFDQYTTPIEEQ